MAETVNEMVQKFTTHFGKGVCMYGHTCILDLDRFDFEMCQNERKRKRTSKKNGLHLN